MAAITLDIAGNTRQLDRDIQKTVNKVYSINLKTKGDQPLGRITGQVNEFNKSLDASNARVIAFGASAGIIFGVERAFGALVQATIEVQKSLQDINVILNASQANLQKFGAELFNIARNTGQSFQEVAKAATEFSRQGLGIEETLKRTNEALILSRLSGLDAAKSVESLTAAVNSFASQAVTATEVVNKFATVDAAFAVSSADLADAIARVGSSAAQSGVSLNELIAIVTSAQQTTARGGAVIGNSFKTIFTRLQREKVVDLLESLGISGTDSSGQVKSTIQLLQDLGAVYDTLGSQQQAYVAEQVGGVFQINILKAALADLGKEYSIYSSALNVAAGATDQAIRRNEELNKTYAAQINALAENARQLAAAGGERLLGPSIDRLVGGTNTLLEGFSESDGQGVGAVLGKGILDGIGQFIAGPGLALIGGVLLKLFRDLAKFATGSVQQLLGLNTAATQQRDLQQSINQILTKNPQLLELALKGSQGLNQAANSLLASLQKQTVELQKQAQVAQQISKAFVAQAGVRVAGGVPVVPTPKPGRAGKAAGYIPNFASDKLIEKYTAISLGATSSVRPHMSQGTIGGKKFVMNNQEVEFPGVGKNGDSMVLPTYGDGPRIAAAGFIPNFAVITKKRISKETRQRSELFRKYGYLVPPGVGNGFLSGLGDEFPDKAIRVREPKLQNVDSNSNELKLEKNISNKITDDAVAFTNTLKPLGRTVNRAEIEKAFQTTAGAKGAISGAVGAAFEVAISKALDYKAAQREGGDFDVRGGKNLKLIQDLFGISVPLADFKVSTSGDAKSSFYDKVRKEEGLKRGNIEQQKNRDQNDARKEALTQLRSSNPEWFTKRGDKLLDPKNFPGGPEAYKQANDRLNIRTDRVLASYGGAGSGDAFRSLAARKRFAYGFIPNFAAQQIGEVMALETAMSGEKAIFDTKPFPHVRNKSQPTFGSAMADHGGKNKALKDSLMGQKKAGLIRSSGFIPNFAIEDPDVQATNLSSSVGAVVAQLGFLAFSLQGSRQQYKQSLKELTDSNIRAAKNNLRAAREAGASEQVRRQLSQNVRTAQAGTAGQKFAAASGAGGFALSIGAPIIAETIKNAIGQETAGARRTGEAVGAAGQIASFAGAGAMFGPWGAAIGAATGALLTVPGVIDSFLTDFPELQKESLKAAQELTQFGEASSRVIQASESYAAVLSNNMASAETVAKAQQSLAQALNSIPAEYRDRLAEAAGTGTIAEESAKIQGDLLRKSQVKESNAQLGKSAGEARSALAKSTIVDVLTRTVGTGKLFFGTAGDVLDKEENTNAINSVIQRSLTGGEFTPEVVKSLEKIPTISAKAVPRGGKEVVENTDDLRKFLEKTGQFDPSTIEKLIEQANIPGQFEKVVEDINQGIITTKNEARSTVDALTKANAKQKEYLENVRKASEAIDAASSSLEKSVAIQNLFKSAFENIQENIRNFSQNLQIEQKLTQPREVLQNLIGADKSPTRRLAAQEGLATIRETERSSIANLGIEFKGTVRDILQKPFQENINRLRENLGQTKEGFKGDSTQIESQARDMINQTTTEYQNLNSVMESVEAYMAQFVNGQISTQQLLEQSKTELAGVGIDVSRGSQASDAIEKAVAELEVKTVQEQVKAFQQRAKLANETKQAILQDKINQALGTFGGFEGFMNRPEEEQNYIQRIAPDLEKIGEIRSSLPFTYNNKESVEARRQQAPALGRSFANVYRELINQSGGAFRGFIQQGLRNRQLTSGQGGRTGKFGGFDDIIAGRQVDLEQQLKLAEDQLKITTDETLKRDLQGFVDSVKNMPGGLEGIATLQTQKEFGVARQSDFQKLFKQYDVAAFDALSEISPELAASLASATALTDDPLLNEASAQTAVQTEILKTIREATYGEAIGTTGMIEPFDIEAYTNEKDPAKRAAMKAGYSGITPIDIGSTAGEAVKKQIKAIQDKVLPTTPKPAVTEPQKTIAEIEAETIAKRDKARAMGTTLEELNRTVDPNSPLEIEKRTIAARDQKRFEEWSRAGGIGLGPTRRSAEGNYLEKTASRADMVDPTLAATDAFNKGRQIGLPTFNRINAEETEIKRMLDPNWKLPASSAIERAKYNPFSPITYDNAMQRASEPGKRVNQAQPAAAAQQSFAQQEAAFNNNTSALTTLAGGIENLNSTLANFEANFANLNNVPGAQPAVGTQQVGAQPNVTTTTNAPVNVVVNAQGGNDIATAVGEAVQNAIPTIIDKVKLALGQKVPPTSNPKFGGGQRADGGFLL